MVDANKWLDAKIPKNQRTQATQIIIYRHCQANHTTYRDNCNYCNYNKNNKN